VNSTKLTIIFEVYSFNGIFRIFDVAINIGVVRPLAGREREEVQTLDMHKGRAREKMESG